MPYRMKKGGGTCGESQWAVVNKSTGKTMGCHSTEKSAKKQLAALAINVTSKESAEEATMPQNIHEQATLTEAAAGGSAESGRMTIQVITPGQGSSGWYSAAVCEAAAPLVAAGTPMYLDHPTESDAFQRPERSLRDLAAVFTEAGRWDSDRQAVVAEAQVFAPYREVLSEMAPYIGVSVRGDGEISEGTVDGVHRRVVESISSIASVDFVTAAGRGGRVLALLESAPRDVAARAVARGLSEATVNDLRDALDNTLSETYGGQDTWVYVRDFDDSNVWFQVSTEGVEQMYGQTYSNTDGDVALTGDRIEVRVVTTYVPVSPAGSSTTQESEEDTMPNIEEARLRELEEAAGRVQTLESERDTAVTERDEARHQLAESTARTTATTRARSRVTEANGLLPAATVDRIVEAATRTVPMTEAGQLDEAAFDTAVDAARTSEETYLAGLAEAAGAGRVAGLGGFPVPEGDEEQKLRESNDQQRAGIFGRKIKEA